MDKTTHKLKPTLPILGWREWASLPELNIRHIKIKLDTGAKTSAIHAFNIDPFKVHNKHKVRFKLHPYQGNNRYTVNCIADVIDQRYVTSSSGSKEFRYVIETSIQLADTVFPIELTLTDRDSLRFRMLLGRNALKGRYLIDVNKSYHLGKHKL